MRAFLGTFAILALASTALAADARDAAHLALLEKDAGYARAVRAFEERGSNVEEWKTLLAGAKDESLEAHATYFLGRSYLGLDDFDSACATLEKLRTRDFAWKDEVLLYLGYAYARRTDLDGTKDKAYRAKAKECLDAIADSAPERVRELARWLRRELAGDGSGPLLELARRMDSIENAIDHERTGKDTQAKQDAVIAELDRLIEKLREKTPPPGPRGSKKKPGTPETNPTEPGGGDGKRHDLGEPSPLSDWLLEIPEHDRAAALQFIQEHFPERYRELVELYYKSLAERTKK